MCTSACHFAKESERNRDDARVQTAVEKRRMEQRGGGREGEGEQKFQI